MTQRHIQRNRVFWFSIKVLQIVKQKQRLFSKRENRCTCLSQSQKPNASVVVVIPSSFVMTLLMRPRTDGRKGNYVLECANDLNRL